MGPGFACGVCHRPALTGCVIAALAVRGGGARPHSALLLLVAVESTDSTKKPAHAPVPSEGPARGRVLVQVIGAPVKERRLPCVPDFPSGTDPSSPISFLPAPRSPAEPGEPESGLTSAFQPQTDSSPRGRRPGGGQRKSPCPWQIGPQCGGGSARPAVDELCLSPPAFAVEYRPEFIKRRWTYLTDNGHKFIVCFQRRALVRICT